MGEHEEANRIQGMVTNNFAEADLAFLGSGGKWYKATGVDIYLQKDEHAYQKYLQLSKVLTVSQSIEMQLPEIYKVIIQAGERKSELLSLDTTAIARANGAADVIASILKSS